MATIRTRLVSGLFSAAALVTTSCSAPEPLAALPATDAEAAELCYFAAIQQLVSEVGQADPTDDQVLHSVYFATFSVIAANSPNVPKLEKYSAFTNDLAIEAKYDGRDLKPYNPQCAERFPSSRANHTVQLPSDPNEAAAMCFYISHWTAVTSEGAEGKDTQTTEMANRVHRQLSENVGVMNGMVRHFEMTSSADGDRLRERMIAQSVNYGTFSAITRACGARDWAT